MYSFDLIKGWEEIEDFLAVTESGDFSEELKVCGYMQSPSGQFGSEFSLFGTEVYVKDIHNSLETKYDFIVSVDLSLYIENIAVKNFPSLVELLSKLSSTAGAALYSDIENEKQSNT
jgi:hypothetical protein